VPDLLRDRLQSSLGSAYTLERELGGGGMSRVFVAKDEALGRDVVVKVLAPELAEGLSAERFAREIRVAAALQEPHIVPVLSAGVTVDGLPYYTMPFVRGESLRARLAAGALPLPDSVVVLRDVATALEYAHGQGLVHRDIKPENVLLSGRTAVVTDFGIAKALAVSKTQAPDGPAGGTLTQVGTSLGTPAYMAPEQAVGDAVDVRADLYAWGVVAYELLAGRHPFAGRTTAQQLVAAHLTEVPAPLATVRPELPGDLAALVARCLAKSSNERPASAQELLAVLEALGDATGRRATAARGHPLVAGALALTVLAGLGLAAASPQLLRRVPTPYTLGATTQVTASPELELDAALSPDGRLLAYVAPRDGVYRVVVRQLAGGRTVVVADTGGPQRAPRWSPDGTQLLYGSEGAVFAVPALGGSPRALVRAGTGFFLQSNPTPAWSPDGRRFAYADTSGILVRALDGGEARRVAAGIELHSPAAAASPTWRETGTTSRSAATPRRARSGRCRATAAPRAA
jgi:tRNA A-37 threonylcarbamoyl transferase component Bud32